MGAITGGQVVQLRHLIIGNWQSLGLPHDPHGVHCTEPVQGQGRQRGVAAGRPHNVTEAAEITGFAGVIGAYGDFFIPNGFGASIKLTRRTEGALYVFILFYLSCTLICWVFYARKHASLPC